MREKVKTIVPVVVLTIICLVSALLLSALNKLTTPLIAANEEAEANEAYATVLPEADSFTALSCDISGVTAVLKADNGTGYVVAAEAQGYGGEVPATVAFSNDGVILKVLMNDNEETPGMGQKVTEDSFEEQFTGLQAGSITIDDIDAISGATISSKAAVNAINLAMQAYLETVGGNN